MISEVQQRLLQRLADGACHSGTALGTYLGISRAAVWKQIQGLQEMGIAIHSQPRQGYQFSAPLTLLDQTEIIEGLAPDQQGRIAAVEVNWLCDSTNSELMRRLRQQQAVHGTVLLAEYQSDGRGRRGKSWVSPFGGSLYLSLLWRFSGGLMALSGLGIVVGIAMAQAVEAVGLKGAMLKWPNDLHYRDQKLGGVLIELEGEVEGPTDVVMGVGLNVSLPDGQDAIDQPWTSLEQHLPATPSRNLLAAALLNALIPLLDRFEFGGLEALKQEWEVLDRVYGQPVAIHQEDQVRVGIARGIDANGALRLEEDGEIHCHYSGDVSLRLSV